MDLDKITIGGRSLAEILGMVQPFITNNAQAIAIGAAVIAAALLIFLLYLLNASPRKTPTQNDKNIVKTPLSSSLPDIEFLDDHSHDRDPAQIAQHFAAEDSASDIEQNVISTDQFSEIVASQYAVLKFDEELNEPIGEAPTHEDEALDHISSDIPPEPALNLAEDVTENIVAQDQENPIDQATSDEYVDDLPVNEDELNALAEAEKKLLALKALYQAGLIAPEIYSYKSRQIAKNIWPSS